VHLLAKTIKKWGNQFARIHMLSLQVEELQRQILDEQLQIASNIEPMEFATHQHE